MGGSWITRNNNVSVITNVKCLERERERERVCFATLKDKKNSAEEFPLRPFVPQLHAMRFICNPVKIASTPLPFSFFRFFRTSAGASPFRRSIIDRAALANSIPDRTKLSRSAGSTRGEYFCQLPQPPVLPQARQLFCRNGYVVCAVGGIMAGIS